MMAAETITPVRRPKGTVREKNGSLQVRITLPDGTRSKWVKLPPGTLREQAVAVAEQMHELARQEEQARRLRDDLDALAPWPTTPGIYFAEVFGYVKIGRALNVARRLEELCVGMPEDPRLLLVMPGEHIKEREYHRRFAQQWVRREWFKLSGELLSFIQQQQRAPTSEGL